MKDELHLSVCDAFLPAENISHLVKQLLDLEASNARGGILNQLHRRIYPIAIARNVAKAKQWLKTARGSERCGIVVSIARRTLQSRMRLTSSLR